jgi:hypothetical protein
MIMFEILNFHTNLSDYSGVLEHDVPDVSNKRSPFIFRGKHSLEDKATTFPQKVRHRSCNETASHLTRPVYL